MNFQRNNLLLRFPLIFQVTECKLQLQNSHFTTIILLTSIQMKSRSYSANKTSKTSSAFQKKSYERVQTEYNSLKKNDSFTNSNNFQSFPRKGKIENKRYGKAPEQMMEQNLNLKSFINTLQEQLTLQRGRLQASKRKNLKFTKQLSREFEKQIYYSGKNPNGYMISGVKHQYQHMKTLYQEKSTQLQLIYRSLEYTNIQELKIQIETLRQENIFLKSNLQSYIYLKKELALYQRPYNSTSKAQKQDGRLYSQPSEDKSQSQSKNNAIFAFLYAEEKENLKRASEKISLLKQKIKRMSSTQAQLTKKLDFLEKLVIEKENNQHASRRQLKRVQKEKIALEKENEKIKELLNSNVGIFQKQLQKIKYRETQKFTTERQIFQHCLKQKNDLIQKLQKEIRFLSTMLSYWKPLDQINREFRRQSDKEHSQAEVKRQLKSIQKEDKMSNSYRLGVKSEYAHQSRMSEIDFIREGNHQNQKSLRLHPQDQFVFKRTITDNRSSNNVLRSVRAKPERPRRDCSNKHSEHAKKVRKVELHQIKHYCELMRYRLLGHKVSIQKVKSYFSDHNLLSAEQQTSNQYITMRQIKNILLQFPFELTQDEAVLVSRYIVQDSNNEYVYWDQENEIDRNIAKSIIKTLVGEYHLPEPQIVMSEWSRIKKIYLQNIVIALKTIAPKGVVTLTKFNELITGLGIEMSLQVKEWMISQLVINSASLQALKYDTILNI